MKILLVEDEPKVSSFIKKGLESQACQVDIAYDGLIGKKMALGNYYDVIILDVNLPHINGFELCRIIRRERVNVPILMLTALGTLDDKLTGFDSGAYDYLVKPFEFRELFARLKALHLNYNNKQPGHAVSLLRLADLELDLQEKVARRAGKEIELTAREFALLEYFMLNRGKVVSKTDIAEKVWEIDFDTGTNIIEVYVNYLRNKIDRGFASKLIHTVVGMGYMLKEK
ncbi:response regulator transcription factor [Rhodocytophaga aerolata]|uniref:Response regulator transcription factor n=1 Tax=Rhodocytophaga aerolata TaxID=455078 RepID=A0ABT8RCR6_9BACT|nr:response regulator transcription factor [Rhodocytophaga aerolata]MDO1449885.1 response regulator transcription factor [Rhodocytophaga aerolata]